MRWKSVVGAAAAWTIAGAAHGQALETGPCDRMNQLLTSKQAYSYFVTNYRGLHRFPTTGSQCSAQSIRSLTLTYASTGTNTLTYNVTATDYEIEPKVTAANCQKVAFLADNIVGTLKITQRVASRSDGYCDLIMEGAWDLRQTSGTWTSRATYRIIVLDMNHFATAGAANDGAIFMSQ